MYVRQPFKIMKIFIEKGSSDMNDNVFNKTDDNYCSSMNVILEREGVFGGPHYTVFDYNTKIIYSILQLISLK